MSPSTSLGLAHAGATVLVVLAAAHLVRSTRRRGNDGADPLPGRGWLLVTLGSIAVWTAHLAWWLLLGPSEAQVLWLPSVGASVAGLLLWSDAVLRPDRPLGRRAFVVLLADPVLLVAAHVVLGADAVAVRHVDRIDYGWFYGVHILLTFAMMLATASLWAGTRTDPSPMLRTIGRIVIGGLLAAGVAQVLGLMVLDLVLALTGTVVVLLVVRTADDGLRPRPRPDVVLDGLGALVLVLDRDDRLVDLNAPARSFFARRDGAPPGPGTRAADLLPFRPDRALTGLDVRLPDGDGTVDLVCFAARLGPAATPAHGTVVVLRPAADDEVAASDDDVDVRFARRVDQLVGVVGNTELVVVLGLEFENADDARRAARAMEFVVGSLDTLVVELVGESSLVAVAPARVEAYVVDVAAGWRPAGATGTPADSATRSVSLSPVLARDGVVRHGWAVRAPMLVAEVRGELAG